MVRWVATLLAATAAVAATVACAPGAVACDLDDLADTSDRMQTPWEIAGYVVGADGERKRVLVGLSLPLPYWMRRWVSSSSRPASERRATGGARFWFGILTRPCFFSWHPLPPAPPFRCERWSSFPRVAIRRPFFLDLRNIRRDITNGRSGVPLYLDLTVLGDCNAKGFGCTPKKDALVDAWHADSRGVYRCVWWWRDWERRVLLSRRLPGRFGAARV